MVTGRWAVGLGTQASRAARALWVAAVCSLPACADIWGFDDLRGAPAGRGSPDTGTLPAIVDAGTGGDDGGAAGTGAGGSASPEGSGGVTGRGDAGDASDSPGSGGSRGGGAAGAGAGTGGASGSGGTLGVGGAGTGGRGGSSGTGGTGVCTAVTRQLLVNPNFESGATGWTTSVAGGFPLIYVATGRGDNMPEIAAQSPTMVAWFGGYNRGDDIGSQSVVIPANATSINLSFFYAIFTEQNGNAENDVLDVTVTSGAQTTTLAHFSNADSMGAWTRFSAALPTTLAGQTVRLQFRSVTNATMITSFYVDTLSLQVVTCP